MATCAIAADAYAQPNAILVVVNSHFNNVLHQTAGCALMPNGLSRTAVIMRFSRFNRAAQGFFIHKAVHQEFATFEIGRDRRY